MDTHVLSISFLLSQFYLPVHSKSWLKQSTVSGCFGFVALAVSRQEHAYPSDLFDGRIQLSLDHWTHLDWPNEHSFHQQRFFHKCFRHDSQTQKVLFTDMLFIPSSIKSPREKKWHTYTLTYLTHSGMPGLFEVQLFSLHRLGKHH